MRNEGLLADFLGKVFEIGQNVVYPTRFSSSLNMNKGEVVSVDHERGVLGVQVAGGKRLSYPMPSRTVIVG